MSVDHNKYIEELLEDDLDIDSSDSHVLDILNAWSSDIRNDSGEMSLVYEWGRVNAKFLVNSFRINLLESFDNMDNNYWHMTTFRTFLIRRYIHNKVSLGTVSGTENS
jgi:hypothetical protein